MKQLYKFKILASLLYNSLSKKRPHIGYVGHFKQTQNLGDRLFETAYGKLFPDCGFIDYHSGCKYTQLLPAAVFNIFDIGLLAGGTLINRSQRALRAAEEFFPACKYPVVFGTGAASPEFWDTMEDYQSFKDEWIQVLSLCKYIAVRGPLSADILNSWGLKNVSISGDPVFALAPDKNNPVFYPKTLTINAGYSWWPQPGKQKMWGNEEEFFRKIVKLAVRAQKEGWKVKWVGVIPQDMTVLYELAAESRSEYEPVLLNDYNEFCSYVTQTSVFVGMKLHATALAVCNYVPSIMLEYRPKCRDFMESAALGEFNIRTDKIDIDDLWDRIVSLDAQRDYYSSMFFEKVTRMAVKQKQMALDLIQDVKVSIKQ